MRQQTDEYIVYGFVCKDHAPEKQGKQWWVNVEAPINCEQCDNQAAYYVMEAGE